MSKLKELAALVNYDPATGVFTRKDGRSAQCAHPKGYVRVRVGSHDVLAHRLAWYMATGDEPAAIDHKNRMKADNRIENLRPATNSENQSNRGPQANCSSGVPGVFWYARKNKWLVHIKHKGKRTYHGYFADKGDAIAARKLAESVFGEFAPQ